MANLAELVLYAKFRQEETARRFMQDRDEKSLSGKYRCKRRKASKLVRRLNDVYIGAAIGSSSKSQIFKCIKLLDTKFNEIYLHGLGHSIPRTMAVAEAVKASYVGTVDFKTKESTRTFIDDMIPLDEDTLPFQKTRTVPELEVHIFRSVAIPL